MDPTIEAYVLQLEAVSQDLPGLARHLTAEQFNWRRSAAQWSVGQCVAHLNITLERYLPVLDKAMADGRAQGRLAGGRFVASLLERWFIKSLEPPVRMRLKAPKAFVAGPGLAVESELARWNDLHRAFGSTLRAAEGLDLARIKVKSQFGPVSFSLGATFSILLAHERRHVWQARAVIKSPEFPAA